MARPKRPASKRMGKPKGSPKRKNAGKSQKAETAVQQNAAEPTDKERLTMIGVETICGWVEDGESQRSICERLKISRSQFWEWTREDASRSARVREAMAVSAEGFMEKAEAVLLAATTNTDVSRARELAQHYRKQAAVRNPRYGDRVNLDTTKDLYRELSDEKLNELLVQKLAHQPSE